MLEDLDEFHKVILECDAAQVIRNIKASSCGFSPIYVIFNDIKVTTLDFNYFDGSLVRRTENVVAHFVARLCTNDCNEHVYLGTFP